MSSNDIDVAWTACFASMVTNGVPHGNDEPVRIVTHGYDVMGDRYTAAAITSRTADTYYRSFLDRCLQNVPEGGVVLDLGCGGGIVAAELSERSHVVGVDRSFVQLETARGRAPRATLIQADMGDVAFRQGSFDAVAVFWSVIHLQRALHADLFMRIHAWLRPGGVLFGTLGSGDNPDDRAEFHGTPMYWSHFDADTNRRLLLGAGFTLIVSDVVPDRDESSLWVIATA